MKFVNKTPGDLTIIVGGDVVYLRPGERQELKLPAGAQYKAQIISDFTTFVESDDAMTLAFTLSTPSGEEAAAGSGIAAAGA
jgi:hypothetical protein